VKMWSGRFREPLDPLFEQWQRSFPFDWRLLPHEAAASQAHARALQEAGVLTVGERDAILRGLDELATAFAQDPGDAANAIFTLHADLCAKAEDVHHFVEMALHARIGETALKLHTGRSRNEQIATDLRLYVRASIDAILAQLAAWADALVQQAQQAEDAVMPAYTHLQRAEPVLAAHWLLAYVEMILRDAARLQDCRARLNRCPLGSGAVAGATLTLNRAQIAADLHFDGPTANSMDATSDRDFVLEFLHTLGLIALHASRFAEEITLYATQEFGLIELPESFSTGSSAMPQKLNPDFTELVRGRTGRILAAAHTIETQIKGLPLAYNKDLQEMQEPLFDATERMGTMLHLLALFTPQLRLRRDRMALASETGYLNAMAAATYLVRKGIPFRTAHEIIGNAVRYALDRKCELEALQPEELQRFSKAFAPDFYDAIRLEATLDCHDVPGGTAHKRVAAALKDAQARVHALLRAQSAGQKNSLTPREAHHARA
jgi:argininosuccinate lyase